MSKRANEYTGKSVVLRKCGSKQKFKNRREIQSLRFSVSLSFYPVYFVFILPA